MLLTRLLPARFRGLAREVTAFGLIGIANTVVDFAVFNGLIFLGPLKANAASTIVATTSSYVMNRHWTYRDRPRTALRREYTLFFAFNLVGLGIQEAVLGLAKYGLGFGEQDSRLALNVFKCLGVAVAMVFRFWAYRTFVFRSAPEAVAPEPAVPETATAEPAAVTDEFASLTAGLEVDLAVAGIEEIGLDRVTIERVAELTRAGLLVEPAGLNTETSAAG